MSISYKYTKLKFITIFFIGTYAASNSAIVNAGWSIKGLGNLGGADSFVSAINDSGQVAGNFLNNGVFHGFISGNDGIGMTDIGTLDGSDSFARAINNLGQVAGESPNFDPPYSHAFITGPGGKTIHDVGNIGVNGEVYDINDSGQIVGDLDSINVDGIHAFITGSNGIGITA